MNRDHPRVGGEKFHSAAEIDEKMGSPPHRRGKVIVNLILTKGHRITPAQAGKSPHTSEGSVRCGDHPRVGGEKHKEESSVMELQGSPPRGRGKEYASSRWYHSGRITPAWAGKS